MRDLISRQAAIDAICKACSLSGDYQKCDGYPEESTWCEELVALRALPSAQSQWIPCSERLPEEERYVLVTASNGAVTEAKYWHKEGIWVKGLSIVSVTAWMPLPKPYRGESDE